MPRIPRDYETPLFLAAASAVLLLVVAGEATVKALWHNSVRADVEIQARAENDEARDGDTDKDFSLVEAERFADLVERPLFFQGRRVPVQAEAAKADKPLDTVLHGVVTGPSGTFALLKEKDGKYHRLREKEMLHNWRLSAILQDRVRLERGVEKAELLLQKPKPKDSPAGGKADKPRKAEPNPKTEKTANANE